MAKKKRILGCNIDSDVIGDQGVRDFIKENCDDIRILVAPKFDIKIERDSGAEDDINLKNDSFVSTKWANLDWDESGIPRSYKEAVQNACIYLIVNILTKDNIEKLKLGKNEAPIASRLNDIGYEKFYTAIYQRRLSYDDIITAADLSINKKFQHFPEENSFSLISRIINFIEIKKKSHIKDSEILHELLYGNFLNRFFIDNHIKINEMTRKPSFQCLLVISIFFLDSDDYYSLSNNILNKFEISQQRMVEIIKKYLGILKKFDEKIDISKHLPFRGVPHKKSYDTIASGFKVCKKCKKRLPIESFKSKKAEKVSLIKDKSKILANTRSICRSCHKDNLIEKFYQKKYKLLYKLFYGKCDRCGCYLIYHPSFEFHHSDLEKKTSTWNEIKDCHFDEILAWAKRDRVVPLCNNCHNKLHSTIFNLFQDFIEKKNIFDFDSEEIDSQINDVVKKLHDYKSKKVDLNKRRDLKMNIKTWLRKRYVFHQLYGGKCIHCRNDELNVLSLHHHDYTEAKIERWSDIGNKDCKEIFEILLREHVVCLCMNCHFFMHTDYPRLFLGIFNEQFLDKNQYFWKLFDEINLLDTYDSLRQKITDIKDDIYSFELPESLFMDSPLKLELYKKDFWKIRLMQVFILADVKKTSTLIIDDFEDSLGYQRATIINFLNGLVKKNFLLKSVSDKSYAYPHFNDYKISVLGMKVIEELKVLHFKLFEKLLDNLNSLDDIMRKRHYSEVE